MSTPETAAPYQNQKFVDIRRSLLTNKQLFEDKVFPAETPSLYYDDSYEDQLQLESEIVWLRPGEIVSDPEFFVGGANRFDIKQGQVGDCWLLAAIAALVESKPSFKCVVPEGQDFKNYCGMFRFRFWQYGLWVEVVVDDRLPCHITPSGPELILMQSEDKNEFWSALLEKAYAKIHGSYQSLEGGATIEAMEDFTGGVAEIFNLKDVDDNLFEVMLKAHQKGSLMGCSLNTGKIEDAQDNGLISGHAYTITGVYKDPALKLVRCRNPWGSDEWTGAWSDESNEWKTVSKSVKKQLFNDKDDGEFWMSWQYFKSNWSKVEICNLNAESSSDGSEGITGWHYTQLEGRWLPNATAGGCIKNRETFWMNPQFHIHLEDSDEDDDDLCTTIIALMQKDRRKGRNLNLKMLAIGFMLYKIEPIHVEILKKGQRLPQQFFYTNKPTNKVVFSNPREQSIRLKLDPGDYVIIPSTYDSNEQGDFVLRIFSEGVQDGAMPIAESQVDESIALAQIEIEEDKQQEAKFFEFFKRIALTDCEIDTWELKGCIDQVFAKDSSLTGFKGFSDETCKILISLFDEDFSGQLGFDEFKLLWRDLAIWKAIFKMYDEDSSGSFDGFELQEALTDSGYTLTAGTLGTVVRVFASRDGQLGIDNFIRCMASLKRLAVSMRKLSQKGIKVSFDECVASFL